jgi:hypothetical protein
MDTLGMVNARRLNRGHGLRGLISGDVYMVKFYSEDEFPWVLENYYTRTIWNRWKTRDDMIKELASCFMAPIDLR